MAAPMLYHRAPAFDALYERVLARLPHVFGTENPVLAFAASGSGAMESAVANLVRPGTPALACAAGKFGERWIQLCEAYGAELVRHEPGWGVRLDPAEIDALLSANPGVEVVFATLSETSTGIVHDVQALAEVVRRHGALFVVDAVSGLGAARLHQDDWQVDVVVAGSQKALMTPPGLAFASVSERALERAAASPSAGRYYFDWSPHGQEPGQGREPVHAGRVALPRARRRARHDRGGGAGERVGAARPARPRHTRRGAGDGARAVRRSRRARHRRHRDRAARRRRRRQGPGHVAQAGHHRQRRPGPPEGSHPADRALRLLRRVRHRHVALRAGDGPLPARPRGRARRRRRRGPEGLPRGRRSLADPCGVL